MSGEKKPKRPKKKAKSAIEAEPRCRATLASVGDGVISTDAQGRVDFVNPAAEKFTGWPEADALGKPLEEVFRIVNEETRAAAENPVERVWCEGVVVGLAGGAMLVARDGAERPIAGSVAPIRDDSGAVTGVALVLRDPTEERGAQRRWQELFDNVSVALLRSTPGPEGAFIEVNPAMVKMFEADSREQLMSVHPKDIYLDANERRMVSEVIMATGRLEAEVQFKTLKGKPIWCRITSVKTTTANGQICFDNTMEDITERKRADEVLRESEDRYRAMMEQAADVVLLHDQNGRVLDANRRACQRLGYSREELLSLSIADLDPEAIEAGKSDLWGKVIAGEQFTFESRQRCRDGSFFPVEVTLGPVRLHSGPAVLGIVRDITERRRAADEIARTAREWQNTFDAANDAIWLLDRGQRVRRSNRTAEKFFHRPGEEMVGKHCWEIVHGLSAPLPECPIRRARKSLRRETMELPAGPDWFEVTVDPILDAAGQFAGAVHIVSDISARKRAEIEIIKLNRVYTVISQINQMVIRTADRDKLFAEACRIAVEHGKFRMAWFGRVDERTQEVKPVAWAGVEREYLTDFVRCSTKNVPEGRGPTGTAGREGKTDCCNDLANDPRMAPWRDEALKRGYRSSIALPLIVKGKEVDVFTIYAAEPFFFNESEIVLLEEIAGDLAFALEKIESENQRRRVEEALEASERRFRSAAELALDVIYERDISTGVATFYADIDAIQGFPAGGYPRDREGFFKLLHPDDVASFAAAVAETVETGKTFDAEFRIRRADGGYVAWAERARLIFDEQGSPVRWLGVATNITERTRAEKRDQMVREILDLLNNEMDSQYLIRQILLRLKIEIGFEAVGIRLKDGDDFPYYETSGFSEGFVRAERRLCAYDDAGKVLRDDAGKPVLECMCGNVLCGRTDPTKPFFTEAGSFWTNHTAQLLATTTEADRQARIRNRCNGEGYESVALIPLRSGDQIIGLLQFNDRRPDQLTPDRVSFLEGLGASIGIALSRKQNEEKTRESEEKFRTLFENNSAAMAIIEMDSTISAINKEYTRIGLYEEADVVGTSWKKQIYSEDLERLEEYNRKRLNDPTNAPAQYEFRFYRKDGEVRECLISVAVIPNNKIIASFVDITDRKRTEEALRKNEQQLSNAVEIAQLGPWEYDVANDLFTFNDHFYKLFRTTAQQAGGYTMSSAEYARRFVHPEDASVVGEEVRKAIETTDPSFSRQIEHRAVFGDGTVGHIVVRFNVVKDAQGRTIRTFGANQDITERRRAEERRLFMEEQLRHNQKLESIGTLAAGVAHEINNPLTSILTFAELIQKNAKEDERLADYSTRIIKDTNRVAAIVKNLLAFARTDKAAHSPAQLSDIINNALSLITAVLRKDQIRLIVDVPGDLPQIKCRSQQIEQVLMNLLTNARDALNERYPEHDDDKVLTITCRLVEKENCPWIRTTVANHGVPIPPDVVPRIFDPFFTTKKPGVGTGLGLSISHGIVKEHNGFLTVESVGEAFTRFHLDLPAKNDATRERNG